MRDHHDRACFESGNAALDDYLRHRASQDAKRGIAFPYVVADGASRIVGFHTLTSTSIEIRNLPARLASKLPRHGILGATLIGRLAVDRRHQRQGIGSLLVAHAVQQSLNESPAASIAVVVDAMNDPAVRFYQRLGFILLPDSGRTLFFLRESLRRHLK